MFFSLSACGLRAARLESLIALDADVLIDNGVVQEDRLRKELITDSELTSAAHRQVFASLDEIDRAILEPGGAICFFAKKATDHDSWSRR